MTIVDINGNKKECVAAYPDPDFPGYMKLEYNTNRKYQNWYPILEFIKNNPTLEHLTKNAPVQAEEIVGIVSSSTDITLTDKKQKWEDNTYKDFPLWISRGKGEGQIRTVIANTATSLIIDKKWDEIPNKTSQYVLSWNVHDPQPLGNILKPS